MQRSYQKSLKRDKYIQKVWCYFNFLDVLWYVSLCSISFSISIKTTRLADQLRFSVYVRTFKVSGEQSHLRCWQWDMRVEERWREKFSPKWSLGKQNQILKSIQELLNWWLFFPLISYCFRSDHCKPVSLALDCPKPCVLAMEYGPCNSVSLSCILSDCEPRNAVRCMRELSSSGSLQY